MRIIKTLFLPLFRKRRKGDGERGFPDGLNKDKTRTVAGFIFMVEIPHPNPPPFLEKGDGNEASFCTFLIEGV